MTVGPAMLSAALAAFVGPGIAAAELYGDGDPESLLSAERRAVRAARLLRRRQFAAGRACARLAMAEHGVTDFELLVGVDRQPRWPTGLVGSITHTAGYCAAAVASIRQWRAVGIDSETVSDVAPRLWSRIAAPAERAALERMSREGAQRAAALTFAAKEAFYKCQFSLTAERLAFRDVVIDGDGAAASSGEFRVLPQRELAIGRFGLGSLAGRFRFHGAFVSAALAIPAVAGPER